MSKSYSNILYEPVMSYDMPWLSRLSLWGLFQRGKSDRQVLEFPASTLLYTERENSADKDMAQV